MSVPWQQIAILVAETFFVAGVIVLLFRLRSRLGLLPLAAFVGSIQYLQTILASTLYIDFGGDLLVSPGSAVLFPAALFAVLLIYQQDGVPQARSLIFGILVSNLTLTLLSHLTSLQIRAGDVANLLQVPDAIFQVNPRIFLAGTAILLLDCLAVAIVYEILFARWRGLPAIARLPLGLLIVLVFDSVVFSAFAFAGHQAFAAILSSQLVSKSLAGAIYGLVLFGFLRRTGLEEETHGTGTGTGIWAILTYRERYEILRRQKKAQEQAFEQERSESRAALSAAESRYRKLFETMNDGLLVVDASNGRIVELNPAFVRLSGHPAEELIGANLAEAELFDAQTVAGMAPQMSAEWETRLRRRRGEPLEVEIRLSRFSPPQEPPHSTSKADRVLVLMVRDVTARKAAELALRRQAVQRMKDRFISTVSHELRTPLTSIYGSLKLVLDGKMGPLEQRTVSYQEVALRNARRLRWLVNDILDFQKIESGLMALDLKTHDLDAVVAQAIEDNHVFADGHGVSLERLDAERVAQGAQGARHSRATEHGARATEHGARATEHGAPALMDRKWLLQVLTNLVSNAVKHSPEGGRVSLGVEPRDDGARVSVRDQGPGIPESFRDQLFQPFSQAQLKEGSSGLGLSIAKALVEKMHGSLGFDSTEGQGTTFYVDLPRSRTVEHAGAAG